MTLVFKTVNKCPRRLAAGRHYTRRSLESGRLAGEAIRPRQDTQGRTVDWQPIETAPKDGTPVRALCGGITMLSTLYEFTAKWLDGRWCAKFDHDQWRPISPAPSHWRAKTNRGTDD